jgi:hypothetical protein
LDVLEGLYLKGIWKRAHYTVPEGTPEDSVQFKADTYMKRFGNALEKQGWLVLEMLKPRNTNFLMSDEKGLKRYEIMAHVTRKPIEIHVDIEDKLVPTMIKAGLKLNE